jgi:hypothetical protein
MSASDKPVRDTVQVTVSQPVKPFFAKKRRAARTTVQLGRVKPAPEVWDTALQLAAGDVHRLQVNGDGSVTVLNHSRFS